MRRRNLPDIIRFRADPETRERIDRIRASLPSGSDSMSDAIRFALAAFERSLRERAAE